MKATAIKFFFNSYLLLLSDFFYFNEYQSYLMISILRGSFLSLLFLTVLPSYLSVSLRFGLRRYINLLFLSTSLLDIFYIFSLSYLSMENKL